MPRRDRNEERELAVTRIRELVRLARRDHAAGKGPDRVRRYVSLARRLGMRYQVSLPQEVRRTICRSCDTLLVSGSTARHRVTRGRVVVTCLACGSVKRYPVSRRRTP